MLVYHALKGDFVYQDPGATPMTASNARASSAGSAAPATTLGFDLVNRDTGEVLHAVSS